MARYRSGRINEEMKKELASLVMTDIRDPRLTAMVSITEVEVTKDLSYAKVYVSIFGTEKEKADSLEAIKNASSFLRREIGRRMNLRHTPELVIMLDTTIDRGMHIDDLIRQISTDKDDKNGTR
ncbi:30S ribosome-binding factor RbfA [Youngiibacter multivorans]|uniref:Ribosome-binding factor A n=1 Tax=Youngiibacter multivorans TaxID=937251 RepID=A0ABS4G1Z6_9CLOT|nr:30S ribosome-binding factor RbfA [Youngiibacter multivorans]MBP1918512.1 ribosome-binding factor A [Youngiibacter multivorans]